MATDNTITQYTLTYSPDIQGWPSFYSFYPEWMIGMNQYFYSFKGGNLYRHNTNETRNNYYGVQYNSTITSVFNDLPLENKIFKTINLEGDSPWSATLETDIQSTGYITSSWFEKKEGSLYGFIRNSGNTPAAASEYPLRSVNGIGVMSGLNIIGSSTTIDFPLSVSIGSIISVGDLLYFSLPTDTPAYSSPQLAGEVTNILVNLPRGQNSIVIDNSIASAVPVPAGSTYIMYIKNSVAESHGVLGHYCVFELTNSSTGPVELFAVESSVMKSYP